MKSSLLLGLCLFAAFALPMCSKDQENRQIADQSITGTNDLELKKDQAVFDVPPKDKALLDLQQGQLPVVELSTTMGKITLELNTPKAPKTVANFLEYVKLKFYAGTLFHRVISTFMIQGGGYNTQYQYKKTNPAILNEADNGLSNLRGTIAMARTDDPDSATAQFFINVVDNKFLDFKAKTAEGWGYCVFGKVIDGMDTVDKIKAVPTGAKGPFDSDAPLTDVIITEAKQIK
jgi:peptidyl-prolyl cis-trans isomerase A (cyclophilin A)